MCHCSVFLFTLVHYSTFFMYSLEAFFTFTTAISASFNGLALEFASNNPFPHYNFKMPNGKIKCCVNPIPHSFSLDLLTLWIYFTICIINSHLPIYLHHKTRSSWGARTLFFSVNIYKYVEQNMTGCWIILTSLSHKILIKLVCFLHLFCFSACFTIISSIVLLRLLIFGNCVSSMVLNYGFHYYK